MGQTHQLPYGARYQVLIILLHITVGFIKYILILEAGLSHNDIPEISADFLSASKGILLAREADNLHDAINIVYDALDDIQNVNLLYPYGQKMQNHPSNLNPFMFD